MTAYICLGIAIIAICYITTSVYITTIHKRELLRRRSEIVSLYVKRANLMPVFFTAARKTSPIPADIYNRFLKARDMMREDSSDRGIQSANMELDGVFADFFSHYHSCRNPLYIKTREDYTKLLEKLNFTGHFYKEACGRWKHVSEGPLKYGAKTGYFLRDVLNKLIIMIKAWRKSRG